MSKIKEIIAREIKDSRGNPTVEVDLETEKETFNASCPSGASTGKNEALELRDEDGKGVSKAIKNVNEIIAPVLIGKNPANQKELDDLMIELDGTENKSKLGANAILPVSMAICRAGADSQKISLYEYVSKLAEAKLPLTVPLAMFNFIEGGAHSVGRNKLDLQEFMIVPIRKSFRDSLLICNKIYNNLKKLVEKSFEKVEMGDEGGFALNIAKTEQALFLLKNSIGDEEASVAIDAAASQFYKEGKYILEGKESTRPGLVDFYKDLASRFNIASIEDPFDEEDFEGFREILKELKNTTIVGDDLTTTNIKRIKKAHNKNACNGVIIKPNQIGTISEAIEATALAKSYGWKIVVSHRSGETMDSFIADLAVGTGADFIKSGSPSQQERMVKYNRLLEIENELSKSKNYG